jgi:hypothetical protein
VSRAIGKHFRKDIGWSWEAQNIVFGAIGGTKKKCQ